MTRDEYVELIKSYALSFGTKAVLKVLVSKIPWLAGSIINPILGFIVEKVLQVFIYEAETRIFFAYTDLRCDAQGRAFVEAVKQKQEILLNGTEEQKREAEEKVKLAFKSLVKLTS